MQSATRVCVNENDLCAQAAEQVGRFKAKKRQLSAWSKHDEPQTAIVSCGRLVDLNRRTPWIPYLK